MNDEITREYKYGSKVGSVIDWGVRSKSRVITCGSLLSD